MTEVRQLHLAVSCLVLVTVVLSAGCGGRTTKAVPPPLLLILSSTFPLLPRPSAKVQPVPEFRSAFSPFCLHGKFLAIDENGQLRFFAYRLGPHTCAPSALPARL